jgi:hypothetical protein
MHTELMLREVEMPELLVVEGGLCPVWLAAWAVGTAAIAAGIAWLSGQSG